MAGERRLGGKGKSIEIAQAIRGRIHAADIPPGTKFKSILQFAGEHHTTVATMSKVFDILESEGLIERVNGLGVFVRQPARKRFAVVFDSASEQGVFAHKALFLKHFAARCRERRYDYTMFENIDEPRDCSRLQKELAANAFDAVLVASRYFAREHEKYLKNIPLFAVGLYDYRWLDCAIDFRYDIVSRAAVWLKERGCARVGVIAIADDWNDWLDPDQASSWDQYNALIAEDPETFGPELFRASRITPRAGYQVARALIADHAGAGRLGLISLDSIFTHGVISAVLESPLALDEDVLLVSHANQDCPMAEFPVPVTAYVADIRQQAELALALAEEYFATGQPPRGRRLLALTRLESPARHACAAEA